MSDYYKVERLIGYFYLVSLHLHFQSFIQRIGKNEKNIFRVANPKSNLLTDV